MRNQLHQVELYIKTHAIPKGLRRVIYNDRDEDRRSLSNIVYAIETAGLIPISLTTYRKYQAKEH